MGLFLTSIYISYSQNNQITSNVNDSTKTNMDAVYNRPFLNINKSPVAIGGYVEANTNYSTTDGINDGFHFQMRRFTLFFASSISNRIKFISEIEFEDGTKEINIENALVDIEFHPLLNLRSGILFNPIGAFNQNHDGPRWDFVDRPIVSTEIIPSTLSSVGMGLHGKYFAGRWIFAYEAYLTNGLSDKLISNELNRSSFAEAKHDEDRFESSFSGRPLMNGKIAIRNRKYGEIGISVLHGIYNKYLKDGTFIDQKRSASILALDFSTSVFNNHINIIGEFAKSYIDLPDNYLPNYGSQQFGFYTDISYTMLQKKIFNWENAKLNIGLRTDYVDFNLDKKPADNQKIGDYIWSFTPSIAFRPNGSTVLRLNYKHLRQTDFENNPASLTGILMFGLSSYF